jgi:hypothetical protein
MPEASINRDSKKEAATGGSLWSSGSDAVTCCVGQCGWEKRGFVWWCPALASAPTVATALMTTQMAKLPQKTRHGKPERPF